MAGNLRRTFASLALAVLCGCGGGGPRTAHEPQFDYGPDTITFYSHDGSDWVPDVRHTYAYDAAGRVTSVHFQLHDGSDWGFSYPSCLFQYDWKGKLESCSGLVYHYGLGYRIMAVDGTAIYGYTPLPYTINYWYDSLGRLLTSERTLAGMAEPQSRVWYYYGGDGRVETEARYVMEISFFYDGEGRLLDRSERLTSEPEPSRRYSYEYNAEGRVETETYLFLGGGAPAPRYRRSYTYDAGGRLTAIVEEEYDDVGGTWEPSEKREFIFTDAGSSYTFEFESPKPLALWIFDYYGQGEANRYLW